jgi:hypothetical protein
MKAIRKLFKHFWLMIVILLGIGLITYLSLSPESGALKRFIPLLLSISSMLVIIDTWEFIKSGNEISSSHNISDNDAKKRFKQLRNNASLFNIFSIFLCFVVIALNFTIYVDFGNNNCLNDNYLMTSEIIFCFIFVLFLIADILEKKALMLSTAAELNSHKSILEYSIPLIDTVGLIGIGIITSLSLYHHYKICIFEEFFSGFSIGALVFHIVLTQFNLAYLNFKYGN